MHKPMDLESEIKEWISEILHKDIGEESLQAILKDGTILCELINALLQNDPNANLKCPKKSNLGFFQMENIEYFISKAKYANVPDSDNFMTIDLYEGKNIKQVINCICALSRSIYKLGRTDIKVLGPRLVDKKPITFTEEQINEAKRTISKQYGVISKTHNF